MKEGWVCPRCGKVNAPFIGWCDCKPDTVPAGDTCRSDCECGIKCYAKKIERLRPSVRAAYKKNYELLKSDPDTYWREVEASIMMSRFFRFHVSGDIVDEDYLRKMIEIADRNRHCEILCFTKEKFEAVGWRKTDLSGLVRL